MNPFRESSAGARWTRPHSLSVLIIDQNPRDGESLRRQFQDAGFLAAHTPPADRLADVLVPFVPDILVIDPVGAGRESRCCKSTMLVLRDRFPQAAIVIVTERPSFTECFEAARLGVAAYLPKPAQVSALLASLASIPSATAAGPASNAPLSLAGHEWEQISRALSICGGNKTAAARILGIPRFTLQRKLRRGPTLKQQAPPQIVAVSKTTLAQPQASRNAPSALPHSSCTIDETRKEGRIETTME